MSNRRTELLAAAVIGLLAAVSVIGCAGQRDLGPAADQVRVEVANVGFDNHSGTHYVLLEDRSGKRRLEILVGDEEARAIIFEMRGVKPERPLTRDLLRDVIVRTGNHLDRVVITRLHDQIYYADIVLDHGRLNLDSRPSDAIALAMGLDAPIFVNGRLLDDAGGLASGQRSHAALPATLAAEGISIQSLSTPIASYFALPPRSGVLVAGVSGPAAQAGLLAGDVVTTVERHPVRSPADFIAALANAKDAPAVTLSVIRSGHAQAITIRREKIARRGH